MASFIRVQGYDDLLNHASSNVKTLGLSIAALATPLLRRHYGIPREPEGWRRGTAHCGSPRWGHAPEDGDSCDALVESRCTTSGQRRLGSSSLQTGSSAMPS